MIFFEFLALGLIFILQIYYFNDVRERIKILRNFFPETSNIKIVSKRIPTSILGNDDDFMKFIDTISEQEQSENETLLDSMTKENDSFEEVEVLSCPSSTKKSQNGFFEVIRSTNMYLCKNKGSSADFNILQDICERHIQKLDSSVINLINIPLYIGLAGTFIGIIVGLSGIDFSDSTGAIDPESISQLLNGVIAAMVASLLGLGFTVWNTALNYKPAIFQNDTDRNKFYNFLQRELLPVLNVGMAGSLTSFKSVLNNFIDKFGVNIKDYHDSNILLNDTLDKQQQVLEEINRLGLTQTTYEITKMLNLLKESSGQVEVFVERQSDLNTSIDKTNDVVLGIASLTDDFKDFIHTLRLSSQYTNSAIELQKQLKDSLEIHFPTIKDHREVWREHTDELNKDIKEVYKGLNRHFEKSSEFIQKFIESNSSYFSGLDQVHKNTEAFVEFAGVQNEQFKMMNTSIANLSDDFQKNHKKDMEYKEEFLKSIQNLNGNIAILNETMLNREQNNEKKAK